MKSQIYVKISCDWHICTLDHHFIKNVKSQTYAKIKVYPTCTNVKIKCNTMIDISVL